VETDASSSSEHNTTRPHQFCGGRPPIERFRLAARSIVPDEQAAAATAPRPAATVKRPAEVSRWVNANGKISLAGFAYNVGATYAASRSRPWWPAGW